MTNKKAPALKAEAIKKLNSIIAKINAPEKEDLEFFFQFTVRDFLKSNEVI